MGQVILSFLLIQEEGVTGHLGLGCLNVFCVFVMTSYTFVTSLSNNTQSWLFSSSITVIDYR